MINASNSADVVIPWISEKEIDLNFLKNALLDIKRDRIKNIAVEIGVPDNDRKNLKNLTMLFKVVDHLKERNMFFYFCYEEFIDNTYVKKYILPKNTEALCDCIKEVKCKKTAEKFLMNGVKDCLIGIPLEYFDWCQIQGKDIREIFSKYDFIVIDDSYISKMLFTYELRRELRNWVEVCRINNIPIIDTMITFDHSCFLGKERMYSVNCNFKCFVPGAKEYIYQESCEILKSKVLYENLHEEVKKLKMALMNSTNNAR